MRGLVRIRIAGRRIRDSRRIFVRFAGGGFEGWMGEREEGGEGLGVVDWASERHLFHATRPRQSKT